MSAVAPRIQRIHRAIRFIEDHLTETITVADVADAVFFSIYHFCRTFNAVAHHSPYDYLIRRRLTQAARRLVESRSKIIDIAFDYRFNSAETFSRAFKKMFAVQPKQFRNRGIVDRREILEALSLRHLELLDNAPNLIPQRIRRGAVALSGLMCPVGEDSRVVQPVLEDLATEEERDSSGGREYFGVVRFRDSWSQSGFCYLAGTRQGCSKPPNPAFVTRDLPAADYARFTFAAKISDLPLILEYIYQTWLPKSGYAGKVPLVVLSYGGIPPKGIDELIEQRVYVPLP